MPEYKNTELRKRAEARMNKLIDETEVLTPQQTQELLHEIQVYQIELEMQNDELRNIQLDLDKSREKYFNLFNQAPVGFLTLSEEGIILEANLRVSTLLGVELNQIKNKFITQFICFENQDTYYVARKNLIKTSKNQTFELKMKKKNGTVFWARFQSVLSAKTDDKIKCSISICDINEQKNAENKLKESEEKYRKLVNEVNDGFYVTNSNGGFTFVNNALAKIMGLSNSEELIGRNFLEFIPSGKVAEFSNRYRKGIEQNLSNDGFDVEINQINGQTAFLEITAVPIKKGNKVMGMHGIVRDVTQRKLAEKLLEKSNKDLVKLNAEKDKLFSIIAHDLRSPFQGFLGLTGLMADDISEFSTIDLSRLAKKMNQTAENLFKLLQNLLEWAQVQKGNINFDPKSYFFNEIVKQDIRPIKQMAIEKGISIVNEISDKQKIFADENMLRTVVRNLLTNAVKFSNNGGEITISAKPANHHLLEIDVRDTGVGISKNNIKKLFRIDEKVGSKGTAGEPSTGLGLLLSKEFIEKQGGKIWVKSELGTGTTFSFSLPVSN